MKKAVTFALVLTCAATLSLGLAACDKNGSGGKSNIPSDLQTSVEEGFSGNYTLETSTLSDNLESYWDIDAEKEYYYNYFLTNHGVLLDYPKSGYYKIDGTVYSYGYTSERPYWSRFALPEGDSGEPIIFTYDLSEITSYLVSVVKDRANDFEHKEGSSDYHASAVTIGSYTSTGIYLHVDEDGSLDTITVNIFKKLGSDVSVQLQFKNFGTTEVAPPAYYKPDYVDFNEMAEGFLAGKSFTIRHGLPTTSTTQKDTFDSAYYLDEDFYGEIQDNYGLSPDVFYWKDGNDYVGVQYGATEKYAPVENVTADMITTKSEGAFRYPQKIMEALQNTLTYESLRYGAPSEGTTEETLWLPGDVIELKIPEFNNVETLTIKFEDGAIKSLDCRLSNGVTKLYLTVTVGKPSPMVPTPYQTWVLESVTRNGSESYTSQIGNTLTIGRDGSVKGTLNLADCGALDTLTGDDVITATVSFDSNEVRISFNQASGKVDIYTVSLVYSGANNSGVKEERSLRLDFSVLRGPTFNFKPATPFAL